MRSPAPFAQIADEIGLEGGAELRYTPRSDAADAGAARVRAARTPRVGRRPRLLEPWPTSRRARVVASTSRALRRFGSQGQQRAALLALLFAQREALLEVRGEQPVMLLDDVMSELDPERRRLLVARLRRRGQALITATEPSQLPESSCERRLEISVRAGAVEWRCRRPATSARRRPRRAATALRGVARQRRPAHSARRRADRRGRDACGAAIAAESSRVSERDGVVVACCSAHLGAGARPDAGRDARPRRRGRGGLGEGVSVRDLRFTADAARHRN